MSNTRIDNLIIGLSEKADGQMLLKQGIEATDNRQKFFNGLGLDANNSVIAALVHGNAVRAVSADDKGSIIANTDAIITNEKGVILTVTVADCLPVYFYDNDHITVGLAHAGWRGVEAHIVSKVIDALSDNYNLTANAINVFIGAHIQKCHFAVREDVAILFDRYQECIEKKDDVYMVNLAGIVTKQLIEVGVLAENIAVSKECTVDEKERYFSYRRDKPTQVQSQVAYIGIL